jgi:hypothetical protein
VTPQRKKEFKVYAVIAAIAVWAAAAFWLGMHGPLPKENAPVKSCDPSIPETPPWKTKAERQKYLEDLVNSYNKKYPPGTDISVLMRKEGVSAADQCNQSDATLKGKSLCIPKTLWRVCGYLHNEGVELVVTFDGQNKILSIQQGQMWMTIQ